MSNCNNDTNSQIKALHARLDRVDSDLRGHFAAQYLQAISFLANPLTATQGALMTAQFASKQAFNKLADSIPGVQEFKQLQHLESAGQVDGLGDYLADVAVGMAATGLVSWGAMRAIHEFCSPALGVVMNGKARFSRSPSKVAGKECW